MWFMSTPCSLLQELSEHCQLHPSQEHALLMAYTWLFWQQALPRAAVGQWHWGAVGACSHAVRGPVCVCEPWQPLQPAHTLCKGHTCTGVHTHSQHTLGSCVCGLQSPRTEGTKAHRVCAPAACGSPQ